MRKLAKCYMQVATEEPQVPRDPVCEASSASVHNGIAIFRGVRFRYETQ